MVSIVQRVDSSTNYKILLTKYLFTGTYLKNDVNKRDTLSWEYKNFNEIKINKHKYTIYY
jgi:hypothetical protein